MDVLLETARGEANESRISLPKVRPDAFDRTIRSTPIVYLLLEVVRISKTASKDG
jgi:hypothetical protein